MMTEANLCGLVYNSELSWEACIQFQKKPVVPIMSVYQLPLVQYWYCGHVINLPQDVASFICSLPSMHG